MTWRQVEVEAFMRTIAAGVRPTACAVAGQPSLPSRPDASSTCRGSAVDLAELADLRAAASVDVSPTVDRCGVDGARDLRRDHAGSVARRLLQPRVVRDQRRSGACLRHRCGACCATPWSIRRCWAVPVRCSTPVGPGAPSTANSGGRCGQCTAPAVIRVARCRSSRAASITSAGGPATTARPTSTNLLPLCEAHHHLVHEGGWTLTMTPDRVVTWTRPDGTCWKTVNTADRSADVVEHVSVSAR